MLRTSILILTLLFISDLSGQVVDDFSDGDFTVNPAWEGDAGSFHVVGGTLNSNGPALPSTIYLATPNEQMDNMSWEFYLRISGSLPSASNQVRVYLVSDSQELTGDLNGYFVELGQTGDDFIKLKRSDGGVPSTLITGSLVFTGQVRIKIVRQHTGQWMLYTDQAGGKEYQLEGIIVDNAYQSTSYFGWVVSHTSSRSESFFLDDVSVEQLDMDSVIVRDNQTLDVYFNQPLIAEDASSVSNYLIEAVGLESASLLPEGNAVRVILEGQGLATGTFTLDVSPGLTRNSAVSQSFSYTQLALSSLLTPSDSTIRVGFNDALGEEQNPSSYVLDPPIEVSNTRLINNNTVELSLASQLQSDVSYRLTMDVSNQSGNSQYQDTERFQYRSLFAISEVHVLSTKGLKIFFTQPVDPSTVSVEHFSLSPAVRIESVAITNDQAVTLELETPLAEGSYQVHIEGLMSEDGASLFIDPSFVVDVREIAIKSFQVNSNGVLLVFDAPLNISSTNARQFLLSEFGQAGTFSISSDGMEVSLDWVELYNSSYLLSVEALTPAVPGMLFRDTVVSFAVHKPTDPGDLLISEIMADPTPQVDLPAAEYVELYNPTDHSINVEGFSINEVPLDSFVIQPKSYLLITEEGRVDEFFLENAMGIPLDRLSNAGERVVLQDSFGHHVDSLSYDLSWYGDIDKDDGGYSLELINVSRTCAGKYNWAASRHVSGGTPGSQNSMFTNVPDTERPEVLTASLLAPDILRIVFTEPMDSLSLEGLTVKGVVIKSRDVYPDLATLDLNLFSQVTAGKLIDLMIFGGIDCSGNQMDQVTLTAGLPRNPSFGELVITEIMADPDPPVGLPSSEYLELYNASSSFLGLQGISLLDHTGSIDLPAYTLPPDGYIVLVPSSSTSDFQSVAHLGLPGWLSLNNTGEDLKILLEDGSVIFEVAYQKSWHDALIYQEGGYSLEMKDPANPCAGAVNWGTSQATDGGTPGAPNSIMKTIPDNIGPSLLSAWADSERLLRLTFDEPLKPGVVANATVVINPPNEVAVFQGLNPFELDVSLGRPLKVNEPISIKVFGLQDCKGNLLQGNEASAVLPSTPDSASILISEILFDPKAGGVDFVELHNPSKEHYYNLREVALARESDGTILGVQLGHDFLLGPGEYVAFTKDTLALKRQYTVPSGRAIPARLPSLPNGHGNVIITYEGLVIDRLDYSEDYHLAFLQETEGVSLERISYQVSTHNRDNWVSASSVVGYATPGYANSQDLDVLYFETTVLVEPKVFLPASSNPALASFTTISYHVEASGKFANVIIYNQLGQPVKTLLNGQSIGRDGFLRWDGLMANGRPAPMGYYIIVFDIYDHAGRQSKAKETVVVARE